MVAKPEEFDVEAPQGGHGGHGSQSPRPGRPARSAVGFIIIGLLLVAAGIVIAPRPAIPEHGIVAHLDSPPQLLWEVPLESSHASTGRVWIGAGEVVAAGSNSVHGLDLATGEIIWDLRAPRLRCARAAQDIACVSRQGARAELIELTMSQGESGRTVQTGLVAALPHAGGLVTIFDQSGSLSVMRSDQDGQHLWSQDVGVADADLDNMVAAVLGDLVLIQAAGPEGGVGLHVAVGVADGAVHEQVNALPGAEGYWVVQRDEAITWYDPSGQAVATYSGGSVLRVDDDPGSDVVFTGDGSGFGALSSADGSQIWQFPAPGRTALPHARLGGTMVGWSEGTWYGLGIADGQERWSRPGDFPRCPCLGSGNILAGVTGATDPALTAIDVTTGAQQWQVPMAPSAGFSYGTNGTHLAVFSVHGLSAWSLEEQ